LAPVDAEPHRLSDATPTVLIFEARFSARREVSPSGSSIERFIVIGSATDWASRRAAGHR
jgi:hypothetical protein